MASCTWCCLKTKEEFCQHTVTKAEKQVNCRRKMKHRVSVGTLDLNHILPGYKKIALCERHYEQFNRDKKEFEKRFLKLKERT